MPPLVMAYMEFHPAKVAHRVSLAAACCFPNKRFQTLSAGHRTSRTNRLAWKNAYRSRFHGHGGIFSIAFPFGTQTGLSIEIFFM